MSIAVLRLGALPLLLVGLVVACACSSTRGDGSTTATAGPPTPASGAATASPSPEQRTASAASTTAAPAASPAATPTTAPAEPSPTSGSAASPTVPVLPTLLAPPPTTAAPPPPAGVAAAIKGYGYPYELTVDVGATVVWTNYDSVPHDVVASDESWGSELLGQGESYSHTFTAAGRYPYICTIHPYMKAALIVR
jgi:plastocyanin